MIGDVLKALGLSGPVAALFLAAFAIGTWRLSGIETDLAEATSLLRLDHDKLVALGERIEDAIHEINRLRDGP